jgi:hypothetical protein
MYVVAIDVGIKNLGLCIFDFLSGKIVLWDCVSLVPNGKYLPSNNVEYVRAFIERFEQYFSNAQQILVERQMRCNMRIVEAVIQALYHEKCIIISARSVKMHYDLSMRNYRANKQKAVEWATQFQQHNKQIFAEGALEAWGARKKRDDLADSLLLVMYYLDTYSNHSFDDYVIIEGGLLL